MSGGDMPLPGLSIYWFGEEDNCSSFRLFPFLLLSLLPLLSKVSVLSDRYSLHPVSLSISTTHIYHHNSLFPLHLPFLKTPLLSFHIYTLNPPLYCKTPLLPITLPLQDLLQCSPRRQISHHTL